MQSSDASYLRLFAAGFGHWRQSIVMLVVAVASVLALAAWRRGNPRAVVAAVAIASIAGVSLWIGTVRPGLAARRTFKTFAIEMRAATGGQPVYSPGGPDYELSYYYGAPILELGLKRKGGADSAPRYVLVWDSWLRDRHWSGLGQAMAPSHPAGDGRRLILLKVEPNRFELSPGIH
jgi:hypothetical protein